MIAGSGGYQSGGGVQNTGAEQAANQPQSGPPGSSSTGGSTQPQQQGASVAPPASPAFLPPPQSPLPNTKDNKQLKTPVAGGLPLTGKKLLSPAFVQPASVTYQHLKSTTAIKNKQQVNYAGTITPNDDKKVEDAKRIENTKNNNPIKEWKQNPKPLITEDDYD